MENGKLYKFISEYGFFISISFNYFKLYFLSVEFHSNEVLETVIFFAEKFKIDNHLNRNDFYCPGCISFGFMVLLF